MPLFYLAMKEEENTYVAAENSWCAAGTSVAPEIAEAQTSMLLKQCSAHCTPSRFPSLVFGAFQRTSGGQKTAVKSGGSGTATQEAVDSGDQKKIPKQEGKQFSQQEKFTEEGTWLKCAVSSGDTGHTPAHAVLFPIDTQCLHAFGCPVCICVRVCVRVRAGHLSLCQLVCSKISIIGIINCTLEFAPF